MSSKKCPSCGETKAADKFGRNRSLTDGLSFYCLQCNRANSNKHYRKRRRAEGKAVRDHSWVPDGFRWCPQCRRAVAHVDYTRSTRTGSGFGGRCKACNNAGNSEAYWKRAYGLSKSNVVQLRVDQGNQCAICGASDPQHLDHDHATGGIRRLLCQRCNHGLGLFRDDPKLLHAAAYYVAFHTARQEIAAELDLAARGSKGANRPGEPPVGSQRRPGTQRTSARTTGRGSGVRRREQAGEADT